jgi:hypothetical protein
MLFIFRAFQVYPGELPEFSAQKLELPPDLLIGNGKDYVKGAHETVLSKFSFYSYRSDSDAFVRGGKAVG